jgi:DNA helicase II / ATP-dependent DNA helicase PcrA
VKIKQRQNVLDYDDLLLYWAEMMKVEEIAKEIGERFDHVLVDEYQDTNRLQSKILRKLKPDGRGLMVVGDSRSRVLRAKGRASKRLKYRCSTRCAARCRLLKDIRRKGERD